MLNRYTSQNLTTGFSLIEIVITIAIVAILAAIAYPEYREYILESRRLDAQTSLLDLAHQQEKYYAVHASYSDNMKNFKSSSGKQFTNENWNQTQEGYYQIDVETSDACAISRCYILVAEALEHQLNDTVDRVLLHSNGKKELRVKKSQTLIDGWDH